MPRKNAKRNRKSAGRVSNSRLSNDSQSFLQCAFAPVDFANEMPGPVPDASGARVCVKRHKQIFTTASVGANDYYFVIAPIPGVAMYGAVLTTGTSPRGQALTASYYPDTGTLFPSGGAAANITAFRYVSNYVELVPTINEMTWTGQVSVWKGLVTSDLSSAGPGYTTAEMSTNGTQSITPSGEQMYVAGNNKGAYAVATQVGPWTYTNVITDNTVPVYPSNSDGMTFQQGFTGLGNLECIFIKITGNFSYTIKVGCCVEYVVPSTSILYDYTRLNDRSDPMALEAYKAIVRQLPVAVSYYENSDFWDRVRQILKAATAAGAFLPGGYGMISAGLNLLI